MPELPDITAYLTALTPRIVGEVLEQLRIASPLLLRTAVPPIHSVEGKVVHSLRRVGKRIVFVFDEEAAEPLFLVLHLMIAGRLHWREVKPRGAAAEAGRKEQPRVVRFSRRIARAN